MMKDNQTTPHCKPFSWRALTSLIVALSFCILVLSGAILYMSPPGRIANWTHWTISTLTKDEWKALHLCFSLLFVFSSIVHLVFNWKALLSYLKNRITSRFSFRWEWFFALLICLIIYFGTRLNLPPFAQYVELGEKIGRSWPDSLRQGPIPHAELLTLKELAREAQIETPTAIERLHASGMTDFTEETVVQVIAEKNKRSPREIYEIIQGNSLSESRQRGSMGRGLGGGGGGSGGGGGGGSGGGGGGGAGSLTLEQYCTQQGILLSNALEQLGSQGIKASGEQTLRQIATDNEYARPRQIMDLLQQP